MNIKVTKTKKVFKGEILLSYGDICSTAYMVNSGCLRSYVIDDAGKEHILQFAPEKWFIGDMDSFVNQKPTTIFIDALEDSEISFLSTDKLGDFSNIEHSLLIEMSTKLRNNLIATNKRVISLLSASAVERYVDFTETYPTLVQRLPLKLIASYIGITPEYLSEIRRKIAKKGN